MAVPLLHGRSLEAAVCCALWAARGGPPDEGHRRRTPRWTSAASSRPCSRTRTPATRRPARLSELPLAKVGGLPSKLDSVADSPIDLLVVHTDQEIDPVYKARDSPLQVVPTETIGQAFDELLAMNKYLRAYQQRQVQAFTREFEFPEEQADPTASTTT